MRLLYNETMLALMNNTYKRYRRREKEKVTINATNVVSLATTQINVRKKKTMAEGMI